MCRVCVQLDTHPEHVAANPENAIIVKPWKGAAGDKGLIELIPFLECEPHLIASRSRLSAELDSHRYLQTPGCPRNSQSV
jgi:NLI interacting factor-like phosphatase